LEGEIVRRASIADEDRTNPVGVILPDLARATISYVKVSSATTVPRQVGHAVGIAQPGRKRQIPVWSPIGT
jgi:hypothetical protein